MIIWMKKKTHTLWKHPTSFLYSRILWFLSWHLHMINEGINELHYNFFDLMTLTFDLWPWPRYPSTWPPCRKSRLSVCPFARQSGNRHTHTQTDTQCQNYSTHHVRDVGCNKYSLLFRWWAVISRTLIGRWQSFNCRCSALWLCNDVSRCLSQVTFRIPSAHDWSWFYWCTSCAHPSKYRIWYGLCQEEATFRQQKSKEITCRNDILPSRHIWGFKATKFKPYACLLGVLFMDTITLPKQ